MRIAFDGTTLRPGRTGVGYYTEHLLHFLARQPEHQVVIVSNGPINTDRPLPPGVIVDASRHHVPRLVWMQTLAARALRRHRVDVAHFTNGMVPLATPTPTVVTIHDMSLTIYPECHPPRRIWLNRPMVDLAARRATSIITVSDSARDDIVRLYGVPASRVHVVHEAAAPQFAPVTDRARLDDVRRRYGLPDRFILYVGTIEPRKNLPMLLEAFAAGWRAGMLPHQLVCVGPYGWLSRDVDARIERLGIKPAVRFAGYAPFDDLPAIYTAAEFFVFPSIYEGFGLPVVEAMACGTPVVTGTAAALREVAGGAALHVDPNDLRALQAALVGLAHDPARRAGMSQRGRLRAREFSWARAATDTLRVYRRAAEDEALGHAPVPAYRERTTR